MHSIILKTLVFIFIDFAYIRCKKRKKFDSVELQTLNQNSANFRDDTTNEQNIDLSSKENHEPHQQGDQDIKESQEEETLIHAHVENHLHESSESLRAEVPEARDVRQGEDLELGTDSGSADTSVTLRDPQQNISLVLHNVICQEVGDARATAEVQPNTVVHSDSQPTLHVLEAGDHEEEPFSPVMNLVPVLGAPVSPMHSAEPVSVADSVYTQPLTDTDGEASQLLVPELAGRSSIDSCNLPPTEGRDSSSSVEDSSADCLQPLPDTNNSQARLVISNANCPLFNPEDLQGTYHQYNNRTNTREYRQFVSQVVGGSSWNEEPNNDRHLANGADVARQISAADSEQLSDDPSVNVLRQFSTDSEGSRG